MGRSSLVDAVRLCEGCRSLRLHARVFPQDPDQDGPLQVSITLSPSQCSLCSLIGVWFRRRRPSGATSVSENDPDIFKTLVAETSERKTCAGRSEIVRRFDVYFASAPHTTIGRFWPCC